MLQRLASHKRIVQYLLFQDRMLRVSLRWALTSRSSYNQLILTILHLRKINIYPLSDKFLQNTIQINRFVFDYKMNQIPQTLQVLIVGARGVGKTKLLDRLMQKPFVDQYVPTENQTAINYNLQLQSGMYNLQITQMSKIPFKLFEPSAITHFDYIIFVYDLSNKPSWNALKKYRQEIEKYLQADSATKCFIIGNKADKIKMDVNKLNFFASHMELSANSEDLNQKYACEYIWNHAQPFTNTNNQINLQNEISKQNWILKPFKVSIPTYFKKIQGNCDTDFVIKSIILGAQCVGKSMMSSLIVDQPFKDDYLPTIGIDFRMLTVDYQGKKYKIQFWDTAGKEKFRVITTNYYKTMNVCFLIYDITSRESFERIDGFFTDMMKYNSMYPQGFIAVLIGNKSDLENKRAVTFEEGINLAEKLKVKFYEVSVKENHGVMQAILSTLEQFINTKTI